MNTPSKPFNIVIVPSALVQKTAIATSRKLRRSGGLFALGSTNRVPHCTLYMVELPLKNMPEVKAVLARIAATTALVQMVPLGYRGTNGWLNVRYQKSKALSDLQGRIVHLLNPLRENLIREDQRKTMTKLSTKEQRNIRQYGFRGVGASFDPHLTLTKFNGENKIVRPRGRTTSFGFEASAIGIFHLGKYGTCAKEIEIFLLTG